MPSESLELFAGTGGLALGMHEAGIRSHTVIEWSAAVLQSFKANVERIGNPKILHQDVREVDFASFRGTDIITGGPPCQPFSNGGKHHGSLDERDMFPQAIRAVAELRPRAFIFENVQGLLRPAFRDYVDLIVKKLRSPDSSNDKSLQYDVAIGLLNAADFGVPQRRRRAFFVGIRKDLDCVAALPEPTHSEGLLREAKSSGAYWVEHGIMKPSSAKSPPHRMPDSSLQRWRTTRDALAGLPDPEGEGGYSVPNHEFRPGARAYPGHTGSDLDQPAKTIKAGVHGVPGGENMVRLDNGAIRYFTVREAARVQTFPDWFRFEGSWGVAMRQIGNAVPPLLGSVVGRHMLHLLQKGEQPTHAVANQEPSVLA
jgi:DNA (cytosine-5)-methyltransferase 1